MGRRRQCKEIQVNSSTRYQPVSEILHNLRAQLTDQAHDDIHLLVKIYTDLKNLKTDRLSPYDAYHWLIQRPTERELHVEELAKQVGFKKGFLPGFLIGFALCTFVALAIKYG